MKEHPIIFNAESVRAILGGRKTQTRRVVSDHNSQGNFSASELLLDDDLTSVDGVLLSHAHQDHARAAEKVMAAGCKVDYDPDTGTWDVTEELPDREEDDNPQGDLFNGGEE